MTSSERWLRRPQTVWLRKALFQIHLWTGLGVGLYIVAISISGSVLVYRNELYRAFTAEPVFVSPDETPMSSQQLELAARRAYAGYEVGRIWNGKTPNQAVEIELKRGNKTLHRLFNPYTGDDLGNAIPTGIRATSWLIDFHDNLLNGQMGRRANGIGALFAILLGLTGIVVWWPGIERWRRSLLVDVKANWKQMNWSLHSALGFWCMAFIVMWGITGAYLAFPQPFSAVVDFLEPLDEANPVDRLGDTVLYWLAYLHFGRFGGRVLGCGATCNSTLKAVWAVVGVVPAVMFVTGAIMWWNRKFRSQSPRAERETASQPANSPV